MATLTFNNTLARPTFTLAWLSNNIDLSVTIPQPTLVATMNDWVLNTTIARPTLVASFDTGESITVNTVIIQPTLTARLLTGQAISFNATLRRPDFEMRVLREELLSLATTISNVSLVASMSMANTYTFSNVFRRPTLVANWFNDQINPVTNGATTYTMNILTTAVSEYTNYNFNSYFKLNNVYFGINSAGVWRLTGSYDNLTEIAAEVATPVSSFDQQGMKACTDAFIFGRLYGDMELVTVNDEQIEREGFEIPNDLREGLHRIRVKIPKGLKGAVWQYKLRNKAGSQFSVNNLEVLLSELQRVR